MKPVYAPRALRDVDDLLAYVHARSPSGARNVARAIERAVELCTRNPYAGAATDEPNLYRHPLTSYRYTIFYRVDAGRDLVEIARIIHAARVKNLRQIPDDAADA